MNWQTWAEHHRAHRERARHAARALQAGDLRPAGILMADWALPEAWIGRVLRILRAAPPAPPPELARGHLAHLEGLSPDGPSRAGWIYHRWVLRHAPPVSASTLEGRLTWALAELARLGAEDRRRMASSGDFPPSAEDALVAEVWRAWAAGQWGQTWSGAPSPAGDRQAWRDRWADFSACGEGLAGWEEAWRGLLLSEMLRGASGAFRSRGLKPAEIDRIAEEWDENMVVHLLGGGEGVRLRGLIAARVLELGSSEPMAQVCQHLTPAALEQVGSCVAHRGSRSVSLKLLEPALPDPGARGARFAAHLTSMPAHADRFIRLHVLRSLVVAWGQQRSLSPDSAWSVVLQHRLRGQSRLRAVITGHDDADLIRAICALPGLAARTRAAMRLIGRSCAHDAFQRLAGGVIEIESWQRPLSPRCAPSPAPLSPLPESELPELAAWVSLATLKGHLGMLLGWVGHGQNDGRDGRWNRLLSAAPERWTSESGQTRRSYVRVRLTLSEQLPGLMEAVLAVLSGFVAVQGDQSVLRKWLAAHWPGETVGPPLGKLGLLQRERRVDIEATLHLIEAIASRRHSLWQA
ncbi:MAG: hypothetical protein ACI8RZ_004896 [Myxococcota bacterium]|jgi:hypothetical protein